tara:strand:- start:342 stop:593 length:252 start_codon:yes stop_codon:yes gene_type:complete
MLTQYGDEITAKNDGGEWYNVQEMLIHDCKFYISNGAEIEGIEGKWVWEDSVYVNSLTGEELQYAQLQKYKKQLRYVQKTLVY